MVLRSHSLISVKVRSCRAELADRFPLRISLSVQFHCGFFDTNAVVH